MEGTEGGEQSQAAVRHLGGEELIKPCDAAGGCCHEIPTPAPSLPVPPCCPQHTLSSGTCQLCPVAAPRQFTLHLSVRAGLRAPCPGHPPSSLCWRGILGLLRSWEKAPKSVPPCQSPVSVCVPWLPSVLFQPFNPNPEFSPSGDLELAEGMAGRCLELKGVFGDASVANSLAAPRSCARSHCRAEPAPPRAPVLHL